jgi:hypothetical protein
MNKPLIYTPQALDRGTALTPAVKKRSISQRVKELGKYLPTSEQIIDFEDKYMYDENRMLPEDKELYKYSKMSKDIPYIGKYTAPIGTTVATAPYLIADALPYYTAGLMMYDMARGRDPLYPNQ